MLRVIVRQARPGMVLARSIIHPRQADQTLLAAGYKLDSRTIARLHELGVYDLWINYPGLEFLDDLFSPELTMQQQRLCETLRISLHEQAQYADVALPIQNYRAVVEDLIHAILNCAATLPFMSVLSSIDDALLRHSAEVSILALMLGLRLDGYLVEQRRKYLNSAHAKDVVNLGVGCMLHDVGELQLPEHQRESRRAAFHPFDDDITWQRHSALGYNALRGQIEPSAATVILNHHQHFDGSGFPIVQESGNPQCGSEIHVFARIAMAADTFQHLMHQNGVPQPTICALWNVQNSALRAWFDPVVLAALLAVTTPFLPGMVVTLSDRRHAIVTRTFEESPCYPEVQILNSPDLLHRKNTRGEREVIDLSVTPGLQIEGVDGYRIADYLYGMRRVSQVPQAPRLMPG
ncbi:MAG TPA: HD domain-containing phosphohydrolase [Phycisphaerae bacterium]|nr:HD domain-containing phosphohydrolase [Phycisphaerae bacterium]